MGATSRSSLVGVRGTREAAGVCHEAASGARSRFATNYFRPGGLLADHAVGLEERIAAWAETSPEIRIDDLAGLLTEATGSGSSALWISGVMSARGEALAWGFSGPCLRAIRGACGICGKSQPYEMYDKVDFKIAVGRNGDCYDRYLMRVAEMRESVSIIKQCLEMMKPGPVKGTQ